MSYIIINLICGNSVYAVNQTTTTDINSIDSNKYPQINGTQLHNRIKALTNFKGLMVIGESPIASECVRGQLMTGAGASVLKDTLQKLLKKEEFVMARKTKMQIVSEVFKQNLMEGKYIRFFTDDFKCIHR